MKPVATIFSLFLILVIFSCKKSSPAIPGPIDGKWAVRNQNLFQNIYHVGNPADSNVFRSDNNYTDDSLAVTFKIPGDFDFSFSSFYPLSFPHTFEHTSGTFSIQRDSIILVTPINSPFLSFLYSNYYGTAFANLPAGDTIWYKKNSPISLTLYARWNIDLKDYDSSMVKFIGKVTLELEKIN